MDIRIQYLLVALSVFLVNFLVEGVRFSFGVLYTDLLVAFPGSKASVAWVGAVGHGVFNFIGIFSGLFVRRVGCPLTLIIGSVIASVGALLSSFTTSVIQLYFTYGIFLGIGFNMVTLATIDLVTHQFDRRRSLVMGIAMCGGGAGGFAFNPLVRYLLDAYGWRGTLLLLSGILLHGTVLGCLCLLAPTHTKTSQEVPKKKGHCERPCALEMKRAMLNQNGECALEEEYTLDNTVRTTESESRTNGYLDSADGPYPGSSRSCIESIFNSLSRFCDNCSRSGIHRNVPAIILLLAAFIRSFAYFIPLTYLPDFVVEKGFSPYQGAWVASIAGVTSCVARILIGWISDFQLVNRLYLFAGCIVCSGLVTILCFLFSTFELIVLYAVLYSLLFSGEISLTPIMTVDVSRKEDGSLVMGLLMTSCAVGALLGTPLAGWLFDQTQSYDLAYSAAGVVIMISGLILLPIRCFRRGDRVLELAVKAESE